MAIKNRKKISCSLTFNDYDILTELCKKNESTQSKVIETGLRLLNKELKNKNLYEILGELKRDEENK